MRVFSRLFSGASRTPESIASVDGGLDLLDPVFVHDPYPTYAALRRQGGLHRCRSGAWIATRYQDVLAAMGSTILGNRPSRYSAVHVRNRDRFPSASVAASILPYRDGPEHVTPRRIVGMAFRARLEQRPFDIGAMAHQLLIPYRDGASFDAMADFASPLSARVICALMGLPESDLPQLSLWSRSFFRLFAPFPSEAVRARTDADLAAFRAYFLGVLQTRRAAPGEDFVSSLLAQARDGLSDIEMADNCMLVFADGLENVDAALANLLLALDRHPEVMTRLRQEPQLRAGAVREGLRYDPPAQLVARVAQADGEVAGQTVTRDSVVFLALGSANRDAQAFPDPDAFDPARPHQAMISFGKGRHSCLGGALVTMELEAALDALLAVSGAIAVDSAAVQWQPRVGHRWPQALPVRLVAA
jgi:cytochrome P450